MDEAQAKQVPDYNSTNRSYAVSQTNTQPGSRVVASQYNTQTNSQAPANAPVSAPLSPPVGISYASQIPGGSAYSSKQTLTEPLLDDRSRRLAALYALEKVYTERGLSDWFLRKTISDMEKEVIEKSPQTGPDYVSKAKRQFIAGDYAKADVEKAVENRTNVYAGLSFRNGTPPQSASGISPQNSYAASAVQGQPEELANWQQFQLEYQKVLMPMEKSLLNREKKISAEVSNNPDIMTYLSLRTDLEKLASQGKGLNEKSEPQSPEAAQKKSELATLVGTLSQMDASTGRYTSLKNFEFERMQLLKDMQTYQQAKQDISKRYGFEDPERRSQMIANYGVPQELLKTNEEVSAEQIAPVQMQTPPQAQNANPSNKSIIEATSQNYQSGAPSQHIVNNGQIPAQIRQTQ
jgi:hypothetical protein